jgi:hypothetical protein
MDAAQTEREALLQGRLQGRMEGFVFIPNLRNLEQRLLRTTMVTIKNIYIFLKIRPKNQHIFVYFSPETELTMMRFSRTPESVDRAQTVKKSSRGRKSNSQLADSHEEEESAEKEQKEEESAEMEQKSAKSGATTKSIQAIFKASGDAHGFQAKVYLNRELLDANFTHLLYANENGRNSTTEALGLLADWLKRNPIKHGYGPYLF